ncbi:hypothetical protein [Aeromicrobium sp. Root472D3]|uniref:hypothetical protein n=1 Tax=Aeromicrobium sp. Root472D3 TaxID=1736540 RepID=UPI0012F89862|nr:hypothetical protein [Aeromicrobium sp. Root472D3]
MTDHQVALLEAWSTFAAMIFAATAAILAYRAYLKESRIEKRLRDSDERAQASLVAAWIGTNPAQAGSGRAKQQFVIIRNASEVPVNDVTCWIEAEQGIVSVADRPVVPPSEIGVFSAITMAVHEVAGKSDRRASDLPVGIEFTDASGTRWRRNPDGRLYHLGETLP